jgi:hypothetical protein
VAGKVDAFLKISVALSLLGAAASVGYYHSIYLPARDAQVDRDHKIESAKLELARRTEAQARQAETQAQEDRLAAQKAAIRDRYQTCTRIADMSYDSNWVLNCKRLADKQAKDRSECLSGGIAQKSACESLYPPREPGASCSLPRAIAADLDSDRNRAHEMCLRESQAGLQ